MPTIDFNQVQDVYAAPMGASDMSVYDDVVSAVTGGRPLSTTADPRAIYEAIMVEDWVHPLQDQRGSLEGQYLPLPGDGTGHRDAGLEFSWNANGQ